MQSSAVQPSDFSGLLRAVRQLAARLRSDEVVVSARELALRAGGTSIAPEDRDMSARVSTA